MTSQVKRPVYLNLFKIRLPITGIVSLAHRVSGVVLFLAIPVAVYLLDRSVASPQDYAEVLDFLQSPWARIVNFLLAWALLHHLLAGIRFLFIDADIGVDKRTATMSAKLVVASEAILVIVLAMGVFL